LFFLQNSDFFSKWAFFKQNYLDVTNNKSCFGAVVTCSNATRQDRVRLLADETFFLFFPFSMITLCCKHPILEKNAHFEKKYEFGRKILNLNLIKNRDLYNCIYRRPTHSATSRRGIHYSISLVIVLTGQFTRVVLNYKLNFIIYCSNMHSFLF